MKKIINSRNSYTISVNESDQTSAKIELFIWTKNETEPVSPTYEIKKNIPSLTQKELYFNITPLIKDFISNSVIKIEGETVDGFVNVKVKRYKGVADVYTLLDTLEFLVLNGFSKNILGANVYKNDEPLYLGNSELLLTYGTTSYIQLYADKVGEFHAKYYKGGVLVGTKTFTTTSPTILSFKTFYNSINDADTIKLYDDITVINELKVRYDCSFLNPNVVQFVNRYGGISCLTFFNRRKDSIEVDSKEANYNSHWDYDVTEGSYKTLNIEGRENISLHSGWVTEDYYELFQDLLLSNKVWVNEVPVLVQNKSLEELRHDFTGLINYEIGFKVALDYII